MKGVWNKSLALALAFSVLAAPLLAQKEETGKAMQQAEMDAARDTSTLLWMGAGFFFGLLGVGAAYILEPDPPYGRTAAMSEQYRMAYMDSYRIAGRNRQTSAAIKGCVAGTLLYTCTYVCCWVIWVPW